MNQRRRFFFCSIHTFTFDKCAFLSIEGRFLMLAPNLRAPIACVLFGCHGNVQLENGKLSKSGFVELEIMFLLAAGGVELSQL